MPVGTRLALRGVKRLNDLQAGSWRGIKKEEHPGVSLVSPTAQKRERVIQTLSQWLQFNSNPVNVASRTRNIISTPLWGEKQGTECCFALITSP